MSQTFPAEDGRITKVALVEAPAPHPFITNPVPVGVGGFALTTFTLGLMTTGIFPADETLLVIPLAGFYGGLVQMIAGFFALRRGDLFPAAFMTTYGAFWWTYDVLILFVVPGIAKAGGAAGAHDAGQAVTIYLIVWTVITAIFTVATLGTNWAVFLTFVEFSATLIVADIGGWTGISAASGLGTGVGEMVLAAMAWYIIGAEIVNETVKRPVFPLFPFKKPFFTPIAAPVHYPEHVGQP
ncbi:MAG: acetate uptake transporter [Acidimicrobiales bacterium]